jgi:hypothetical protein
MVSSCTNPSRVTGAVVFKRVVASGRIVAADSVGEERANPGSCVGGAASVENECPGTNGRIELASRITPQGEPTHCGIEPAGRETQKRGLALRRIATGTVVLHRLNECMVLPFVSPAGLM